MNLFDASESHVAPPQVGDPAGDEDEQASRPDLSVLEDISDQSDSSGSSSDSDDLDSDSEDEEERMRKRRSVGEDGESHEVDDEEDESSRRRRRRRQKRKQKELNEQIQIEDQPDQHVEPSPQDMSSLKIAIMGLIAGLGMGLLINVM